MFTLFMNIFFPHQHSSSSNPRKADWLRLGILFYVFMALSAFGHNYVNYPIKDKEMIEVLQKFEDRYDETRTIDLREEETVAIMKSGAKATMAGVFWPAYVAILINEELAQ